MPGLSLGKQHPPAPVRARTEFLVFEGPSDDLWLSLLPSAKHWPFSLEKMEKPMDRTPSATGSFSSSISSWTHLEAQAQQLTESNEQMAPQAKDAGKSERSWVSFGGKVPLGDWMKNWMNNWMLVKTQSSSWKKLRPPVFWLGPPVCFWAFLRQEDLNSDCLAWPESTSSWSF